MLSQKSSIEIGTLPIFDGSTLVRPEGHYPFYGYILLKTPYFPRFGGILHESRFKAIIISFKEGYFG